MCTRFWPLFRGVGEVRPRTSEHLRLPPNPKVLSSPSACTKRAQHSRRRFSSNPSSAPSPLPRSLSSRAPTTTDTSAAANTKPAVTATSGGPGVLIHGGTPSKQCCPPSIGTRSLTISTEDCTMSGVKPHVVRHLADETQAGVVSVSPCEGCAPWSQSLMMYEPRPVALAVNFFGPVKTRSPSQPSSANPRPPAWSACPCRWSASTGTGEPPDPPFPSGW